MQRKPMSEELALKVAREAWPQRAAEAIQRDGGKCVICGDTATSATPLVMKAALGKRPWMVFSTCCTCFESLKAIPLGKDNSQRFSKAAQMLRHFGKNMEIVRSTLKEKHRKKCRKPSDQQQTLFETRTW